VEIASISRARSGPPDAIKAGSANAKAGETTAFEIAGGLTGVLSSWLNPVLGLVLENRPDAARDAFLQWSRRAARTVRSGFLPNGVLNVPLLYCAAAQAIDHQTGAWMRNRGAAVLDHATILPADLIRREKASAAIARMVSRWLGLSEAGAGVFDACRNELLSAIFANPPEEFGDNPYCSACPKRCWMLPLVGRFARDLTKKVAASASTTQTDTGRFARVSETIATAHKSLPVDLSGIIKAVDPDSAAWRNCVAANVSFLCDAGVSILDSSQKAAVFQVLGSALTPSS
jgi:hypothetical protein